MEFDLVFEGGGAKGSVFVGALEAFEERGHTARRIIGTSAGAITATLMAAGYKAEELRTAFKGKTDGRSPFSTFMDAPERGIFKDRDLEESLTYAILEEVDLPWIPGMARGLIDRTILDLLLGVDVYRKFFSFIERGGLYAGEAFRVWFTKMLDDKSPGLGQATLRSFRDRTRDRTRSELSLVASDTEWKKMLVLNHRTAPDCPVAWAVRMSMSIPFLWQEVKWDPDWGPYQGKAIDDHTIVDGGVLSNFPIHLLASRDPDVVEIMGDKDPDAVPTLGLLIDETREVAGAEDQESGSDGALEGGAGKAAGEGRAGGEREGKPSLELRNLRTVKRIGRLVDTMTNSHDSHAIKAHARQICRLPAKGYGTTEFDMDPGRQDLLIAAGKKAMEEYLDGLTFNLTEASRYAKWSPAALRSAIQEGTLEGEGGGHHPYEIKQTQLAQWMAQRSTDLLEPEQ